MIWNEMIWNHDFKSNAMIFDFESFYHKWSLILIWNHFLDDKRDNVTQLFLNSVIRLNSASGAAVTTAAAVNTDDD